MRNKDEHAVSTAVENGDTVSDVPLQSVALLKRLVSYSVINQIASKRSDIKGLKQVAFHGGCIALSGCLIKYALFLLQARSSAHIGWAFVISSIVLHGYFLSFLFMSLHECVHQTAFASSWLNKIVAFITGLATLRPPYHYKLYHFAHHRFTGNREKDPELSNSLLDPDINTLGGYLLYLSSIPFWVSRSFTVLRHAIGGVNAIDSKDEFFIATPEQKQDIVREARLFWVTYVSLAVISYILHTNTLLIYWAIPSIIGQPFLRFYLLAEHNGCQLGVNMLANTRTTVTYAFYRKLAWNMPYHAEHHAWPSVPFHLLPKVHNLVNGVSVTESGCNPSGKAGYFAVHKGVLDAIKYKKKPFKAQTNK
jgi:fatty acid desaturase